MAEGGQPTAVGVEPTLSAPSAGSQPTLAGSSVVLTTADALGSARARFGAATACVLGSASVGSWFSLVVLHGLRDRAARADGRSGRSSDSSLNSASIRSKAASSEGIDAARAVVRLTVHSGPATRTTSARPRPVIRKPYCLPVSWGRMRLRGRYRSRTRSTMGGGPSSFKMRLVRLRSREMR